MQLCSYVIFNIASGLQSCHVSGSSSIIVMITDRIRAQYVFVDSPVYVVGSGCERPVDRPVYVVGAGCEHPVRRQSSRYRVQLRG